MRKLTIEVKTIFGRTESSREYSETSDMMLLCDSLVDNTFESYSIMINRAEFHTLENKVKQNARIKNSIRLLHEISEIYKEIEDCGHIRIEVKGTSAMWKAKTSVTYNKPENKRIELVEE